MNAPICMKCQREMHCKKNGVKVKDRSTKQFPSTVYSGDLFSCPCCGAEIVTGCSRGVPMTSGPILEEATLFLR